MSTASLWNVLMHLVRSLHLSMFVLEEASWSVCWLMSLLVVSLSLPLGVERKALRPPSPTASSTTAAGTSEEEGLHTFSLPPHTAGVYFGGGTGPPPHTDREYLGGGRTGLPPRTVGVLLVHLTVENNEFVYVHT